MFDNMDSAYAVSFQKIGSAFIDEDIVASFADYSGNTFWVVTDGGAGNRWLYSLTLNNNTFQAKYNISMNYVEEKAPQDIWCGRTHCYITFGIMTSNTAENDGSGSIVRVASGNDGTNNKGDIVYPVYNTTGSGQPVGGLYQIEGKDSLTGGFGGVNLWVDACYTTHSGDGCRHRIVLVDGVTMGLSATFPEFFSGAPGYHAADLVWNNIAGTDGRLAVSLDNPYSSGDSSNIQILNTATFNQVCTSINSGQSPQGEDPGAIEWDTTNDKIYQISGGADAQHIAVIEGEDSCVYDSYVTTSTTGLSDAVGMRDFIILADQDIAVLQEGGANARISVMPYSDAGVLGTYESIYDTFPSTAQDVDVGEFTLRETTASDGTNTRLTNRMWIPYSGADRVVLYIEITADDSFTSCDTGYVPVILAGGTACYPLDSTGSVDLEGVNPLLGGDTAFGIGGLPATFAILLNIEEEAAELATTIGLILLSLLFIIIPAWRFGVNPPFFVYFIIILMDLGFAVVLTWIEPLYFMVAIAVAALGAGLKWSGVL